MKNTKYTTWQSAYERGRKAEGKTMHQLFTDKDSLHVDKSPQKGKKYNKSQMGDAFESWFYKPKDEDSEPDLMPAHVELKTTPFRELKTKNKDGSPKYSAKERLVLNIINYMKLVHETFMHSHFLYKNKNILLAFYKYHSPKEQIPKSGWRIYKVILYRLLKNNPVDLGIIRNDWNKIQSYVEHGKAQDLNERMTDYLAACTKGANHKSVRKQPYSKVPAKQRAFSFKASFMTKVLRDIPKKNVNSIFHGTIKNEPIDLESYILHRINKYKGCSNKDLAKKFHVKMTSKTSKESSLNYQLISAMFGLDSQHNNGIGNADELQKADIIPKTVEFNRNDTNSQSMSLPSFSFRDFNHETWYKSKLRHQLYGPKFLFCAFKDFKNKKARPTDSIFMGATIYQFPIEDIDGVIENVWKDTKAKVINGQITLTANTNKQGKIWISNNLTNKSDEKIIHVRPHTSKSDYSYKGRYTDYIPWGLHWIKRPSDHLKYSSNYMTRQCFWINNDFIAEVCKDAGLLK